MPPIGDGREPAWGARVDGVGTDGFETRGAGREIGGCGLLARGATGLGAGRETGGETRGGGPWRVTDGRGAGRGWVEGLGADGAGRLADGRLPEGLLADGRPADGRDDGRCAVAGHASSAPSRTNSNVQRDLAMGFRRGVEAAHSKQDTGSGGGRVGAVVPAARTARCAPNPGPRGQLAISASPPPPLRAPRRGGLRADAARRGAPPRRMPVSAAIHGPGGAFGARRVPPSD